MIASNPHLENSIDFIVGDSLYLSQILPWQMNNTFIILILLLHYLFEKYRPKKIFCQASSPRKLLNYALVITAMAQGIRPSTT